jgi:hypothetical protein
MQNHLKFINITKRRTFHALFTALGTGFVTAFVTALVLALPALFVPLPAAHAEEAKETTFRDIRIAPGLATSPQFIDVVLPFLSGHPESAEGKGELTYTVRKSDGGVFEVNIILKGYLDDSVMGEHYRGHVIQTSDGWELTDMAVKALCYRGVSADDLCT